jgi:hypothetical protein
MPEGSPLSYLSTQSLRDTLLSRNLPPYNVEGGFSPNVSNPTFEYQQSNSSVIDTPSVTINYLGPASQSRFLGALNQYGPPNPIDGAELISTLQTPNIIETIDSEGNPVAQVGNFQEYDYSSQILPSLTSDFYKLAVGVNKYSPSQNGFLFFVDTYLFPNTGGIFYPNILGTYSQYTLVSLITEDNPQGSNGPLANDTTLAKIGAQKLKDYFNERLSREVADIANLFINTDALSNPFGLITGTEKLIEKDYRITVGTTRILTTLERISGTYFPSSIIPGQYFTDPDSQSSFFSQLRNAFNNTGLGQIAQRLLRSEQDTPSTLFLDNTGSAQKSFLFKNLNFNLYKPFYERPILERALNALNPFDNSVSVGFYYVGNENQNPSTVTTPNGEIPEDSQGREVSATVYGQDILSQQFEGVGISNIDFGLKGKSSTDSIANIDGGFIWTTTESLKNAGKRGGLSGSTRSQDPEYRIIANVINRDASSSFLDSENNDTINSNSILVKTQQLIESAEKVDGDRRRKHVGHAINQLSKVFNDGYREITKGSRVMAYTDEALNPVGYEYCRVFAKDTPYYTFRDLQKTTARVDGKEENGNIRKSTYSVFDSTFNLNIAPYNQPNSTNIFKPLTNEGSVKKYMFSIENLAWASSTRAGLTYSDLPVCERGPNGGRVMWFPPYNLSFSDTSTPNFNSNSFLGRPEPIYTYKDTSRTGQLSWKLVVDHPSIVNMLVNKVYKNTDPKLINKLLDSFFAGCKKYDLYELAAIYNKFPWSFFYEVEQILSQGDAPIDYITETIFEDIVVDSVTTTTPDPYSFDFSQYEGKIGFYYENDYPNPNSVTTTTSTNYQTLISTYLSTTNKDNYINTANEDQKNGVEQMFGVIDYNWEKVKELMSAIYVPLDKKEVTQMTIYLDGTTSPTASVSYNKNLAQRRVSNVENTFKTYKFDGVNSFSKFISDGTLKIVGEGLGEVPSVTVHGSNSFSTSFQCGDNDDPNYYTTNGPGGPPPNNVKSAPAMGCRRVGIRRIEYTPAKKEPVETRNSSVERKYSEVTVPKVGEKPEPNITTNTKLRDKVAKKLLRYLLSECDYFTMVNGEDPLFYDTVKQKIQHFHPTFHSMTPEGLNSRLTFLQQCVRPGDTIPTIGKDGEVVTNADAVNTSFGAPPVLVLRIGDFYNTKIIPTNLSITYDPLNLDLNPEGIGVQPMIANISLSFNIIGGMGLKEPVDKLQNALSFNFYANTEMYDDRADETESTKALDEALVRAIFDKVPINPPANNGTPEVNGGTTIGDLENISYTENGSTGVLNYKKVMDGLLDNTVGYYKKVFDTTNQLFNDYGYGFTQLITKYNNCFTGELKRFTSPITSVIAGKYTDYQPILNNLLESINDSIDNDTNYFVFHLENAGYSNSVIRKFKKNLKKVFQTEVNNLVNSSGTIINELTNNQQEYYQLIRKVNYIDLLSDGKIRVDNSVSIYQFNPSSSVGITIQSDFLKIANDLNLYIQLYTNNGFLDNRYDTETFQVSPDIDSSTISAQKIGTILYYSYKKDINKLIDSMIVGIEDVTNPTPLRDQVETNLVVIMSIYEGEVQNFYKNVFNGVTTSFNSKWTSSKYTPYVKGIDRKVDFTEQLSPTTQQTTELQNIYKTVNLTDELYTFNDKIEFL